MPVNSTRVSFHVSVGGADDSKHPTMIPQQGGYEMGVNTALREGFLAPRPGIREQSLAHANGDGSYFELANFQGAISANPGKGLSAQRFASDRSLIAAAVGGRKYMLDIGNDGVVVSDETQGLQGSPDVILAYWVQGENYIFHQDGLAPAYIYDGATRMAEWGKGYDSANPLQSQVPHAATVGVYNHGRMEWVVDKRFIPVGDPIHRTNLTSSINILGSTEQVHWATGRAFAPPTMMGDIVAAMPIPVKDTRHGHEGTLYHTRDGGIFSLNTNVFPREEWASTPMTRIVQMDSAAQGPYALDVYYGDQFYRSRTSIDSIRSSAQDEQAIGSPDYTIGEKIRELLSYDHEPWLEFASLTTWRKERRILCTIQPRLFGRYRDHRGLVSANFKPVPGERNNSPAWEGVWTMPRWAGHISQLVRGVFQQRFRQFAFTRDQDEGINRLVEFDPRLKYDYMANGDRQRISWQVISPGMDWGSPLDTKEIDRVYLHLDDICTDLDYQVYWRTEKDDCWTCMSEGCIEAGETCDEGDCNGLLAYQPRHVEINLGKLEGVKGKWIQFWVKLRGWAKLYGIEVERSSGDQNRPDVEPESCIDHSRKRKCCEFRIFEYLEQREDDEWYRHDDRI